MHCKSSQVSLIAVLKLTVLQLDGWERKDVGIDLHGLALDVKSPFLESLLSEESLAEVLDGLELLVRVLPAGLQHILHLTRVLSNLLRNTIN